MTTVVPERPSRADEAPPSQPVPVVRPGWLLDWWPLIVLAVLAFAIRWPNLWYIPQFTDEVFDAQVSFDIWEGRHQLYGVNRYTGAWHYYVQAALFWLFGPSIYLPRLLILVLGVGAVLATALLGAELGRRAAGGADTTSVRVAGWIGALVAGGLLATSGVHVLINSHLAWPHCTVLLYLTLSFWLLERAVANPKGGGPLLAGSGLMFGLAQQQHPTMLFLWPVFLGYVAWRGWRYFRTRWAYAAIGAFLVGISPLIIYNLTSDFGTLKESREQVGNYQEGEEKDLSYRGRAIEIAQTMPRIAASAFDLRPAPTAEYLWSPRVWFYTALAIAGLTAAAWLGAWSLPLAVVAFLLLLPLFPAVHDGLPRQGRYLMPLFPLIFAGVGGLAALIWQRLAARGVSTGAAALQRSRPRMALAVVLALVVLYPLVPLARYELDVLAANETNDRYYVTLGALERQRRPNEPVVLDPTLQNDRTGAAGTAQRTFDFMMQLRGIRRMTPRESSTRIANAIDTPTALVLADLQPSSLRHRNNADVWTLEPLENDEGGGFTIWRITRR